MIGYYPFNITRLSSIHSLNPTIQICCHIQPLSNKGINLLYQIKYSLATIQNLPGIPLGVPASWDRYLDIYRYIMKGKLHRSGPDHVISRYILRGKWPRPCSSPTLSKIASLKLGGLIGNIQVKGRVIYII